MCVMEMLLREGPTPLAVDLFGLLEDIKLGLTPDEGELADGGSAELHPE